MTVLPILPGVAEAPMMAMLLGLSNPFRMGSTFSSKEYFLSSGKYTLIRIKTEQILFGQPGDSRRKTKALCIG
jgi:hypothetical protein